MRVWIVSIIAGAVGVAAALLPIVIEAQPARPRPAAQAAASNICVGEQARQTTSQCPANALRGKIGRGPNVPSSHLQTSKRREEKAKQGPTGPSIEIDQATAMNRQRVQARAWQLLQREVEVLNRLVRNTRNNDPRRPEVLLRLAETQFEMQQAINAQVRTLDEPIFRAKQAKNQAQVRTLTQQQQQFERQLGEVRDQTIRTYATLVQDHPNFRQMDRVLFSLAFGLDEMRRHDQARQVYYRLIKGFPQSSFVPHAWLSFAEFYFSDEENGSMSSALEFYTKVLEFPPERNPVYGYALYKSAWASYNLEDFESALRSFVRTIEYAQQNPEAHDAENLARQSRRELILPYSRVGSPNQALEFFRRFATNQEQSFEMFESLGELYYDTGQWPNTISVYQRLIAERPTSERICYWQSRITNANISSRPKPEQVREIQRLVDLYEAFVAQPNRSEQAKNECKASAAQVLIELATAWHREAVGTAEQPGTNDRTTMRLSSQLYRMLLEEFPDMERMQFPDIDRRDWPTQYKVSYFLAELLWKMEQWDECGPAFDRVVELNPQGEFTADAAYAAVLCYDRLYQQQYTRRERETRSDDEGGGRRRGGRRRGQQEEAESAAAQFAPRDFTQLENGMLNAYQRYICFVEGGEDLPTMKYRRARIYYDANRFEEAALLFRDIAWTHRQEELAPYAANLYLDSLIILAEHSTPPRNQCLTDGREAIEPLSQYYCANAEQQGANSHLCERLDKLRCGFMRKEAENLHEARRFSDAGRMYVDIFRRFRSAPEACSGDNNQDRVGMDEVLWNAAIEFEAARLLGRAIQVRRVLIERFAESPLAKRAVYLVGANYHALAIYSQAADYYEQFARRFPGEDGHACTDADRAAQTCAIAPDALRNAVFFRLGLGEEDKAIELAQLFARSYGQRAPARMRRPREVAQVVFSLGSIYERRNDWPGVADHYGDFLREYARTAMPHQVIRANTQIAHAFWVTEDHDRARRYLQEAVTRWERGAPEAINGLDGMDDAARALALFEAKDATSEALFYLAEFRYQEVQAIQFPRYRGGRSLERVNEWSQRELLPWVQRKQEAIAAASQAYERIAPLEVPAWQIAAAARIGEMIRTFVDEFRNAPVPDEIEDNDELRDIYLGALDEQSEPFVRQAIDKFEFCIITATRVRWFNDWSQRCEQELNRLDPRRFPLAAELRGQPRLERSVPARPAAVELRTGDEGEDLDATQQEGAAGGQS